MPSAARASGRDAAANPAVSSGHTAAVIMTACGAYTFLTLFLPRHPGFQPGAVLGVALIAILGGVAAWCVPWDRLPDWPRLALGPAAAVLITEHNVVAGLDPFKFGMFYFMIFLWLGLCERRWSSLKLAPFVTLCYLTPLVATGASQSAILSVSYAVPLYVTVGEVLAWRTEVLGKLRAKLQRLADHDTLTGLPNRGVFDRELGTACESGEELALIFIDLDGFKAINDRFGHQAGDLVLVEVAGTLRESVRTTRGDLAFRLAGDEFVVLLRGRGAVAAAPRVGERVLGRLAGVTGPDGTPVRASIGVASDAAAADRTTAGLVRAADEAMYQAKRTGAGLVTAA